MTTTKNSTTVTVARATTATLFAVLPVLFLSSGTSRVDDPMMHHVTYTITASKTI